MTDATTAIQKLKEEAQKALAEAETLERLQKRFPDLQKRTNRWGYVKYCSAAINPIATDVDFTHNCGCCADSPLEMWMYATIDGQKIYTIPEVIFIGERDPYRGGDTEYGGWEDTLRKHKINEAIIAKGQNYLALHRPSNDEDDVSDESDI